MPFVAPAEHPHGPSPSLVEGKASPLVGLTASAVAGSTQGPFAPSAMRRLRAACLDVRDLKRLAVILMDGDPFDPAEGPMRFAHDEYRIAFAAEGFEHGFELRTLQDVTIPGLSDAGVKIVRPCLAEVIIRLGPALDVLWLVGHCETSHDPCE